MKLPKNFPTYDQLMAPTLTAIRELGGSARIEEILDVIMKNCRYPEEFLTVVREGSQISLFEYRASWARTYLKMAGVINNSTRGVWTLTEMGKTFDVTDTPSLIGKVKKQGGKLDADKAEAVTASSSENEVNWKESLLEVLMSDVTPDGFERLSQQLLREAGFKEVRVTGKSNDGGIDGVGILRSGLLSETVLFQCKRYQGSVGAGVIRDFRGAMQGRSTKGIILTTGTFTSAAKEEATRDGVTPIELIDGSQLCDLLKQYKLGVDIEVVEEVKVKADWLKAV